MSFAQVLDILPQQLVFGVTLGSVYALLALGYTMVYGILRMINFAHGDVFMIGSFVGWAVFSALLGGGAMALGPAIVLPAMMLCAVAVCSTVGVALDRFVYRPLYTRGAGRLVPLIGAIGASLFLQNFVLVTQGARMKVYETSSLFPPSQAVEIGSVRVSSLVVLIVATALVVMFALDRFVAHTRLGRGLRAVAENRDVAYLMGVDPNRIVSLTFLIGSALAGIGGVLIGLYYTQIDFFLGWFAGLKAFAAAVLGGIGNIRGAMVGGLALGVIESLGVTLLSITGPTTGFGVAYKDMIAFAVLIAVLIFRPTGILGERVSERA
jgi:branched-chain amino acid transport system permease protein